MGFDNLKAKLQTWLSQWKTKTARQWIGLAGVVLLFAFASTTAYRVHQLTTEFARDELLRAQMAENKALREIIETSPRAMVGLDSTGKITIWTRGAEALFGYSTSEVVGRDAAFLMPGGSSSEHTTAMRDSFHAANISNKFQTGQITCTAIRKSGEQIRIQIDSVVASNLALAIFRRIDQRQ